MVVLPTPGPPVMTSTFERSARRMASAWLAASSSPILPSTQDSALPASISGQGTAPDTRRRSRSAMPFLGVIEAAKKMHGVSATLSAVTVPSAISRSSAVPISASGTSRSFSAKRQQLTSRQPAMTVAHGFSQRIRDPGADADHGRLLDPEFLGDQIGRPEPDASDVPRQSIWVLAHHLHGIGAVGLEDAHRSGGADAVAVQEHHDLADDLLVGPGRGDLGRAHRSDALNLP